jgi:hypothetical protein
MQRRHRLLTLRCVCTLLVSASWAAGCVHRARSQATADVPALLAAAFRDQRGRIAEGLIVVSPYHLTARRLTPRWSDAELARILAGTGVRLAVVDEDRCPTLQPLMCVLQAGEVGIAFAAPRINGDTARVDVSVFGRVGSGEMFSSAHTAITLVRRQDEWVVIGRRRLGGS